MKHISTSNAFCKQIAAYEPNHRVSGDESLREITHHAHSHIFSILEQN